MTASTTIGIAQWLPRCDDPDGNLGDALRYVAALADRGCELIVLPEMWPCGYDPATVAGDARTAAEPLDGPRARALAKAARTYGVWLFAGTVPELAADRIYNTAPCFGPDGHLAGAHRKVHLYTPLDEHEVFAAGERATVIEIDGLGTVGLSTCFDGDHPAYARSLHDAGARIVIALCAYEIATESWWDILYPANALANGQWWIMANQCGGDLLGKSRIIAPDGTIVAQGPRVGNTDGADLIVATVDLAAGIRAAELAAGALWA